MKGTGTGGMPRCETGVDVIAVEDSAQASAPGRAQPPAAVTRAGLPHDGSATLAAVQSLSLILILAIFTVTFLVQPFRIPSASMEPTLLVGDFLLVSKGKEGEGEWLMPLPGSVIRRKDVVVFFFPVDPTLHLVKRVIGLPGDRVRMRKNRVFINGVALDEPYAVYTGTHEDSFRDNFPHLQTTDPDVNAHWWIQMHRLVEHGELRVPEGQYFVLGDNRNDSEDSRYWGLVPAAAIVGEPLLVYFSLREPDDEAVLPRDRRSISPGDRESRRSLLTSVMDAARWNRVLHVVR